MAYSALRDAANEAAFAAAAFASFPAPIYAKPAVAFSRLGVRFSLRATEAILSATALRECPQPHVTPIEREDEAEPPWPKMPEVARPPTPRAAAIASPPPE